MLETGTKGTRSITVTEQNTAKAMGSGELPVFATPAMIALVEETAWRSISDQLAEGEGTVGTKLDIKHLAATPLGGTVTCETELMEVNRRQLVFRAVVKDEAGVIGEGLHERFIVRNDSFLTKAEGRLKMD